MAATWEKLLADDITTAAELKPYLSMTDAEEAQLQEILNHFPMRIPRYYFNLIDWEAGDRDPIFRHCIPSIQETSLTGSFDTSGEGSNTKLPGLQHKYGPTALILSTSRCAMYCRHCFRKRLVGEDAEGETHGELAAQVEYIKAHPELNNLLISGGDSFLNSTAKIRRYLEAFCAIDHLDILRFGTRTPVSFPMRITEDPELIALLKEYSQKKRIYVVTHYNHPREMTPESKKSIELLTDAGVVVRDQTVLLNGINSDAETLATLLRDLTKAGVIPYYVFQCRPVTGVKQQFQVPLLQGYQVVQEAKDQQNGFGKSFRYIMSHETGKIEILGPLTGKKNPDGTTTMLFKYHQAREAEDAGRIFTVDLTDDQTWLDDEIPKAL